MSSRRYLAALLLTVASLACCQTMDPDKPWWPARDGGADAGQSAAPSVIQAPNLPADAFVTLKAPAEAHAELCAPDGMHPNFPDDADVITKTFCQDLKPGGTMPTPHGLADLLVQLGLDFKDPAGDNAQGGNPGFAILGHSSALTARKVTTLAPTAFVFTPPPTDGSPPGAYVILAFDPGEQFVEVASYDPTVKTVNFYVVLFDQACTSAPGGCTTTELLTPQLVTGWSNVRVYEDTSELGNTIFDCHVCHQPDNAAAPILRMQENSAPFTHWFSQASAGGRALLADFHAAHGASESYGPIPAAIVDKSDPSLLAALVARAGFGKQPNAFPSATVEAEVAASAAGQPGANVPPGRSPTWQALYASSVAGQFIAAPYHDVKVTDPGKIAPAASGYRAFLSGSAMAVPDLRDVFFDEGLRDMGFAPAPGLDGRAMLVQMCQECHQSKLDPTISRERFLVDRLDGMSRAEKDVAIARLQTDPSSRLHMPPVLFRTMTPEEQQAMIEALQQ